MRGALPPTTCCSPPPLSAPRPIVFGRFCCTGAVLTLGRWEQAPTRLGSTASWAASSKGYIPPPHHHFSAESAPGIASSLLSIAPPPLPSLLQLSLQTRKLLSQHTSLDAPLAARQVPEGKGRFVTKLARGELVYEGEIVGGEPDGEGQEWLPNGDGYVGEFVSGKRHGKGALTTARCEPSGWLREVLDWCRPWWWTYGETVEV